MQFVIVEDIVFNKEKLKIVQQKSKNTIFVKELAMLIWGNEELLDRSVTGSRVAVNQGEARKPLTPEKLNAIKGIFN